MNEIFWPEDYIPGFTDNFASNEVIVAGLSAVDVWPLLSRALLWPTYYSNSANIRFYDGKGPELDDGVRFYFETFGFPVEAQVLEYVPPTEGRPGRVGWHGWEAKGIRASIFITRGCSRIFRAAECASSRRNLRRVSQRRNWPTRSPT